MIVHRRRPFQFLTSAGAAQCAAGTRAAPPGPPPGRRPPSVLGLELRHESAALPSRRPQHPLALGSVGATDDADPDRRPRLPSSSRQAVSPGPGWCWSMSIEIQKSAAIIGPRRGEVKTVGPTRSDPFRARHAAAVRPPIQHFARSSADDRRAGASGCAGTAPRSEPVTSMKRSISPNAGAGRGATAVFSSISWSWPVSHSVSGPLEAQPAGPPGAAPPGPPKR